MVKYADGPTAEITIEIEAPPAAVWPIVTDINTPAAFSDEFQGADWVDDGPAIGARFEGHNRRESMEWTVPCTVTGFEPERLFEWTVGDVADKVARWRFELTPTDAGSQLRFDAEMGPGRSGLTPMIERNPEAEEAIVEMRLGHWRENMTNTVEGIKVLAEASTAAGEGES
ncbi:MAG: SRPBCC family protein [Actinomycetota bacterium]